MSKKVNRNLRAFAVCARNVPEYDMEEEFAKAFLALADVVDALELVKGVAVTRQCCIVCGVAAQHAHDCPVAALVPFLEERE